MLELVELVVEPAVVDRHAGSGDQLTNALAGKPGQLTQRQPVDMPAEYADDAAVEVVRESPGLAVLDEYVECLNRDLVDAHVEFAGAVGNLLLAIAKAQSVPWQVRLDDAEPSLADAFDVQHPFARQQQQRRDATAELVVQ